MKKEPPPIRFEKKFGIHSESTVLKWVKQEKSHVELSDFRKIGGYLMTKDINPRKTILEECIRIVEYYIANSNLKIYIDSG